MLKDRIEDSLTFDDVLLLPGYSKVLPSEVSVKSRITQTLECNIPLISSAMDTVTEHQTAICMAQEGGIGIIHKNMTAEDQATQVRMVKRSESGMISDPITVEPEEPLQNALDLMEQYRISGVPVTKGRELVGILTNRDLRFETNFEQPVSALMTKGRERLITVATGIEMEEAKHLLHKHRIEKLLVVSEEFELVGLITIKDIEKARKFPDSNKDDLGRLRVGAALGTSADLLFRAETLIKAGVDERPLSGSVAIRFHNVVVDTIRLRRDDLRARGPVNVNDRGVALGEDGSAIEGLCHETRAAICGGPPYVAFFGKGYRRYRRERHELRTV